MKPTVFALAVASAVYWPLEIAYLNLMLKRVYEPVITSIQGKPSYARAVPGGLIAYAALWTGLIVFVLRDAHSRPVTRTASAAATYAFAVYAVYNATNLVTFDNWTWMVSLIDIMWGIGVITSVSTFTAWIVRR